MNIILFEDARVPDLYPITIGRPAMVMMCGGSRLIDQVTPLGYPVHVIVQSHLVELVKADFPDLSVDRSIPDCLVEDRSRPRLFVNARLVPSIHVRRQLAEIIEGTSPGIVQTGSSVAAIYFPAGFPGAGMPSRIADWLARLIPTDKDNPDTLDIKKHGPDSASGNEDPKPLGIPTLHYDLPLFENPHDLLSYHLKILADNLLGRIRDGYYQEIRDGLFVADDAHVDEHVVCNTVDGPVVIDRGASIGPFSYLNGPIYIGPRARILEHTSIKEFVSIGHTTKIGGEVEASIIEPYTNKQHHGFIGHSYLGSWINLGAGTCNSDLKNTYGTVKMVYGDRQVATDMQFVGVIIGDYSKSAINTGFFTGKTVGVCSMVYGFVTTNVPSFVNYARLFGQVTATPVEVMIATQSRMFSRRNVEQRPCDIQLIHDMHELTRHERELGSVPLEPLSL